MHRVDGHRPVHKAYDLRDRRSRSLPSEHRSQLLLNFLLGNSLTEPAQEFPGKRHLVVKGMCVFAHADPFECVEGLLVTIYVSSNALCELSAGFGVELVESVGYYLGADRGRCWHVAHFVKPDWTSGTHLS